ncbi:MAG: hypothetical protein FD545_000026 [Pelagibacterales bacterium]|nr:hypothetical protein [Pelagibacterales bacterium]
MNKNILKAFVCFLSLFIFSCAGYENTSTRNKIERKYFSSKGFALIYDIDSYENGQIDKRFNTDNILVIHNNLKTNTPIRIINPINSKEILTKVFRKTSYSKVFTIGFNNEIAKILDLDLDNPFVEIIEIKRNKTFVAKKSNIYDEEKNVAEKAPVDSVTVNILSETVSDNTSKSKKIKNFYLIISDFYYLKTANDLKNKLIKNTNNNNFNVIKLTENKHRLVSGPFKNFNSLKNIYISLNNLGFEDLNVYRK